MPARFRVGCIAVACSMVLMLAGCGGGGGAAAPGSSQPAASTTAIVKGATAVAVATTAVTATATSSIDTKTLVFMDRAMLKPALLLNSDQPFTITSCSRPDALGLKLDANRADGAAFTIDVANGTGTLQFTKRPGQGQPAAAVPATVVAGPNGALLVRYQVNEAAVACR